MAILWNIIKFSLSVFIIYYLPGFLLIGILKTKASVLENVILSFCAGLFVVPQIAFPKERKQNQTVHANGYNHD